MSTPESPSPSPTAASAAAAVDAGADHRARLQRVHRATDFPFTYVVINPLNRLLLRPLAAVGATPNVLTLASLAFTALTGWLFYLRVSGTLWAGPAAVFTGFISHQLDALDGDLARYTATESDFGGVFDSVCDRFREMWWVLAIAWGAELEQTVALPAMLCLAGVQLYFYANDVPIRIAQKLPDRQAPGRWKFTLGPYGDNPTRIKLGLFEPYLYALPIAVALGLHTAALWVCACVFWAALVWKLVRVSRG